MAPAPQQPQPLFDQSGGEDPVFDPEPLTSPQDTQPVPPPSGPPPPVHNQPKFRDGYTKGNRLKAADYDPPVEALLIRAGREYEVRVSTLGAFPDVQQQNQWAVDSWASACTVSGELYEMSQQMKQIVSYLCYLFSVFHSIP